MTRERVGTELERPPDSPIRLRTTRSVTGGEPVTLDVRRRDPSATVEK